METIAEKIFAAQRRYPLGVSAHIMQHFPADAMREQGARLVKASLDAWERQQRRHRGQEAA